MLARVAALCKVSCHSAGHAVLKALQTHTLATEVPIMRVMNDYCYCMLQCGSFAATAGKYCSMFKGMGLSHLPTTALCKELLQLDITLSPLLYLADALFSLGMVDKCLDTLLKAQAAMRVSYC